MTNPNEFQNGTNNFNPTAPVEPVAPVAPVAPVEPVAPVAPAAPAAPVTPAAPAAPAAPVAPAAPAAPAYGVAGNVCTKCGATVPAGQSFCTACGQQVVAAAPVAQPAPAPKKKSKKKIIIPLVIVGVIFTIILIGAIGGSSGPDLESMYYQYCESTWADISSDGDRLSIDTNPYNWDDDGIAYMDAYYAVENVNNALGLPSSLLEDMEETSYNDGRQTRYYDNLTVTWTYHPDQGLEVTYSKN